jgi:predicted amidohydrolase YtcJ
VVSPRTLIRGAQIGDASFDVLVDSGHVAAMAMAMQIDDRDIDHVIDADGGALLPGLHDHHVHLTAMAARGSSVDLDDCATPTAVDVAVSAAASAAGGGWVRVVGYDEHRHGELDVLRLDAISAAAAVRIQHRSGLSWTLSTAALQQVEVNRAPAEIVERDIDGRPTGRIHRGDEWLGERIDHLPLSFAAVAGQLAACGITGVTDATAELGAGRLGQLERARAHGELPQRIMVLGVDDPVPGFLLGPRKLLVDEQLGLDPDALAVRIAQVHAGGRAVALHAVTRAENITAVTALCAAGVRVGDRIEHGSIMPLELDELLADAGITVIIQPALVGERGDHHLVSVDPDEITLLHRQASFLAAGVRVAAGSDAPVTSVDPWRAIATAVTRRSRSGVVVGESERVDASVALGWYLSAPGDPGGDPRRIEVGAPADLCLLDVPLASMLGAPDASHVRSTWIDGVMVTP